METADQAQALRELGCDHAQGMLFGAPEPGEELVRILPAATPLTLRILDADAYRSQQPLAWCLHRDTTQGRHSARSLPNPGSVRLWMGFRVAGPKHDIVATGVVEPVRQTRPRLVHGGWLDLDRYRRRAR